MRERFDIDDFIAAARKPGATAPILREELGLSFSLSYINRLMKRYVGARPSQKFIERRNVLRDAVVAYMESQGLDKGYCYSCERKSVYDCAIHPLKSEPTLDDFVFVCTETCAAPGDF